MTPFIFVPEDHATRAWFPQVSQERGKCTVPVCLSRGFRRCLKFPIKGGYFDGRPYRAQFSPARLPSPQSILLFLPLPNSTAYPLLTPLRLLTEYKFRQIMRD